MHRKIICMETDQEMESSRLERGALTLQEPPAGASIALVATNEEEEKIKKLEDN